MKVMDYKRMFSTSITTLVILTLCLVEKRFDVGWLCDCLIINLVFSVLLFVFLNFLTTNPTTIFSKDTRDKLIEYSFLLCFFPIVNIFTFCFLIKTIYKLRKQKLI